MNVHASHLAMDIADLWLSNLLSCTETVEAGADPAQLTTTTPLAAGERNVSKAASFSDKRASIASSANGDEFYDSLTADTDATTGTSRPNSLSNSSKAVTSVVHAPTA